MATGDENDMLARSRAILPRWFPDVSPILDGLLAGQAAVSSFVWSLIEYAKKQTRITTATDGFLDMVAYDYFGLRFRRKAQEADVTFSARIKAEIIRPRATRASVKKVLLDTTGDDGYLYFEPANPTDTGGYGIAGHMGWSVSGRWGSLDLPHQAFIIPLRPPGQGIPNAQGYRLTAGERAIGGLDQGSIQYGSMDQVYGPVTDLDIYAALESVKPAGTVLWTAIHTTPPESFLDTAVLDIAPLT